MRRRRRRRPETQAQSREFTHRAPSAGRSVALPSRSCHRAVAVTGTGTRPSETGGSGRMRCTAGPRAALATARSGVKPACRRASAEPRRTAAQAATSTDLAARATIRGTRSNVVDREHSLHAGAEHRHSGAVRCPRRRLGLTVAVVRQPRAVQQVERVLLVRAARAGQREELARDRDSRVAPERLGLRDRERAARRASAGSRTRSLADPPVLPQQPVPTVKPCLPSAGGR